MSSSLESGSPPTRNVTGRVAKLSAARIHKACASSARSAVKRPPLAARSAASSADTRAAEPAKRTASIQRSRRAVLPPAPAPRHQPPVAGAEGDAQEVVAHGPEPLSQGARRRGRDHRAEGAAREPRRVEREPCAAVGELLAQQVAADARLGGR